MTAPEPQTPARRYAPGLWAIATLGGAALFATYVATLAPDVTFWDAGEFIAAAKTLGIPHPPGTPLVVLLQNVWAKMMFFLPFAVATNSFSAVMTAAAGAFSTALLIESCGANAQVLRGGDAVAWYALAGVLCAGGMSTVWMNATETEVYSVALSLAVLMVWSGQRAGRRHSLRWQAMTAYLIVASVPLHLSALVAAPAAAYFASTSPEGQGRIEWDTLAAFGGLFLVTMGFGTMSWPIAATGALVLIGAGAARGRWRTSVVLAGAGLVAATAVLVLLVRARLDPVVNQGNPSTWSALADVIARRQYDVPGMWPRRAPFWLQVANMFQYADWQVALALAPGVIPSVGRILMTVLFAALGIVGSLSHRRTDRRGWQGLAILCVCGSLGIVVYVNFRAGASFGYGILPDNAVREARDRDYFYYLGFWVWGFWGGWGALWLVQRWWGRLRARGRIVPRLVGIAVASLPIALNWRAVSRHSLPGAELPRALGEAILESAPPRSVLIVAGDNDTYLLWYLQQVHHVRPDVTTVTSPLLNALWYQREVARRTGLLAGADPRPEIATARLVAAAALAKARPLAASMLMPAAERNQLNESWTEHGMVYVATGKSPGPDHPSATTVPSVDRAYTRQWAAKLRRWQLGPQAPLSTDPSDQYYQGMLSCPALWLAAADAHRLASLDSLCNRR